MSDIAIPGRYADLVAPALLAGGWSITPASDLPRGDIVPGHSWRAVAALDEFAGTPLYAMPEMLVEGVFSGWTGSEGYFRTAVVKETFRGELSTTDRVGDPPLPADVHYKVDGEQLYWLLPGGFPDAATRTFSGVMHFSVGPDLGAPDGLAGQVTLDTYFERSYVQQPVGPFPWPPDEPAAEDPRSLLPGLPVRGNLSDSGEQLSDGTLVEYYSFFGRAQERVELRLDSREFDAHRVARVPRKRRCFPRPFR